MDATIVPKMQKHYPVLLKEIISVISPQHGGTFIDCTFGQGGYSKKILDFKNTKVIAIDRDIESEKIANQLKESDVTAYRAGIWKPRTRPGMFEGGGGYWIKVVAES